MPDSTFSSGDMTRFNSIFLEEQAQALSELIQNRGLLTSEQLAQAREEATAARRPLGEILIAKGLMQPSDHAQLIREIIRQDVAQLSFRPPSDIPEEARELLGDPSRNLNEFVLVSKLGQGGAGEVWKAWDRELHRWVAIKTPVDAPKRSQEWERFRVEALASARLTHPNIVPIFRVADENQKPYLVMQLIEGKTLEDAELPVRRAVELIREAASAVDYAHQHGVVHRDIKPGNIMIDRQDHVWIMDFGLAHLLEGKKLTITGTVFGTPQYMSPEQAGGAPQARDRTTDIYSLGATLYELVTGKPPIDGDSATEVMRRIQEEDPPSPRELNPSIETDLETILLKALEKEPERRYPTAAELAEDLRRYLSDEPIAAKPVSWKYRVLRRIRKNRVVFGTTAVVLMAVVAVLVIAAIESNTARQLSSERETALQFMREAARNSVDTALKLRRGGSNEGMASMLPMLELAYTRTLERAPDVPEVDYLMGRMHRVLMDDAKALVFQEQALRKSGTYAPALYERAILRSKKYGEEYQRTLESLRLIDVKRSYVAPTREQVEGAQPSLKQLRESILRDMELLKIAMNQKSGEANQPISPAKILAVEGILAYHERRYQDAWQTLEEATRKDPLIEEAWEALGHTAASQGSLAVGEDEKMRYWGEAESWFSDGLKHDRGYIPLLLGRGGVRRERALYRHGRGQDPHEDFAHSESDYTEACRLARSSVEALVGRANVRNNRGVHKRNTGADPTEDYEAAEKDYREALKIDPRSAVALTNLGALCVNRGVHKADRNQNGMPDYETAEKLLGDALDITPSSARAWMLRGLVRANRALSRSSNAEALSDLALAERDYDNAIRILPESAEPWLRRARLRTVRGVFVMRKGDDPTSDYAQAEEDYAAALKVDNQSAEVWIALSTLRISRSRYLIDKSRDPIPDFKSAVEACDQALKINSNYADGYFRRGDAYMFWGWYRWIKKEDPAKEWDAGERDLTEALRLNPKHVDAWIKRGNIHFYRGSSYNSKLDRPAAIKEFESAMKDYDEAAKINPTAPKQVEEQIQAIRKALGKDR